MGSPASHQMAVTTLPGGTFFKKVTQGSGVFWEESVFHVHLSSAAAKLPPHGTGQERDASHCDPRTSLEQTCEHASGPSLCHLVPNWAVIAVPSVSGAPSNPATTGEESQKLPF